MKLSFVPGGLELRRCEDGSYLVTVHAQKILRTRSRRAALEKFTEIRAQMEGAYPPSDLTQDEKEELLRKAVADAVLAKDSTPRKKKSTTARSTRTFGG